VRLERRLRDSAPNTHGYGIERPSCNLISNKDRQRGPRVAPLRVLSMASVLPLENVLPLDNVLPLEIGAPGCGLDSGHSAPSGPLPPLR